MVHSSFSKNWGVKIEITNIKSSKQCLTFSKILNKYYLLLLPFKIITIINNWNLKLNEN